MGIWIKARNGRLRIIDDIEFDLLENSDVAIVSGNIPLGYYPLKRANEVGQMIQEHINRIEYFRATGHISEAVPAVFEMPKE